MPRSCVASYSGGWQLGDLVSEYLAKYREGVVVTMDEFVKAKCDGADQDSGR